MQRRKAADGQKILERELGRLKSRLKTGYELRVVWNPDGNNRLSGRVDGNTIYIFDEKIEEAVKTLKHEFLDYVISKIIEPYRNVANKLIMLLNEETYRRKEEIIENLCELI
ncbi:MAG: hypothetical protein QXW77_02980 [Candidatus Hadarchaeales archaeon]